MLHFIDAISRRRPDADLLREMIGFAAQRLMEMEVEGLTGAGYGEKNPERLAPSATATATAPHPSSRSDLADHMASGRMAQLFRQLGGLDEQFPAV
jgi:hypothetical protein